MRVILSAAFFALPVQAQGEKCWIEVSRDEGWIVVEAFADPADWSEGRYSLQTNIAAYGNSTTTLQAGDFAQDAIAPPLARLRLYSSDAGRLAVKLTVSDGTGRSCEDVIAY